VGLLVKALAHKWLLANGMAHQIHTMQQAVQFLLLAAIDTIVFIQQEISTFQEPQVLMRYSTLLSQEVAVVLLMQAVVVVLAV
tara:strand:- start:477 stop:725 length:249 start_codon:yes stop_codon:yes gene_type:complete